MRLRTTQESFGVVSVTKKKSAQSSLRIVIRYQAYHHNCVHLLRIQSLSAPGKLAL